MKNWLLNPFRYTAGWTALGIGWAMMLLTAVVAFYSKTHFDGVIDAHTGVALPLWVSFVEPLIDWGATVLLFYVGGRIVSATKFRLLDLAGTLALARAPMLILAIAGFLIVPVTNVKDIGGVFVLTALVDVVFCVWMVVLFFQAFMLCCNVKGVKAIVTFIVGILLAEVLARVFLFHFIYPAISKL